MKYIRQLSADAPLYEQQDTCVICGRYLPEGSGMVCQDCMATVDENMPRISGKEETNEPGTCFNQRRSGIP